MSQASIDKCRGSAADRPAAPAAGPRRIDIRTLLGADREVLLIHRDAEYRLRVTSNGKLILTK
ncbi:MAG: hemin uptake protein HemP [Alphaproteobacteria bacterium]